MANSKKKPPQREDGEDDEPTLVRVPGARGVIGGERERRSNGHQVFIFIAHIYIYVKYFMLLPPVSVYMIEL